MRVAYVLPVFPKLSQTFILNEIVELIRRGYDVQIFSLRYSSEGIVHDEVYEYNLLDRTHYFTPRFILRKNPFRFTKYFVKAVLQSLRAGRVSRNELVVDAQLAYFATIMEEKDVELIHAHFASIGTTARRLSEVTNLPYTFTAHAFDIFVDLDTRELRRNIEAAACVFTPSRYNKDYITNETKCDERKIKIAHATIYPEKFKRKKEGNPDQIITAGRLVEKKGIEYLIKAMEEVAVSRPEVKLRILGTGPLKDDLRKLVLNQKLQENVYFLGEYTYEDYYKELEKSAIAVLPCIVAKNGDRDVCPLTLQEAMSMELPVVSTGIHSIPELIDDGISGILVPQKDEKALADAIIKLLNNLELRKEMGRKGREKILREFNIGIQVNKLTNVWEESLKSRRKRVEK
jgi:glycosyltransferase involved in cell wall biosynthesis